MSGSALVHYLSRSSPVPADHPTSSTNRGSVVRTRSTTTPSFSRSSHGDDTDPRHQHQQGPPHLHPHSRARAAHYQVSTHPRQKEPSALQRRQGISRFGASTRTCIGGHFTSGYLFLCCLHRQDFRVLLHPVATGDYGPSSGAPDIFSSLLRRLAQPGYAIPLLYELNFCHLNDKIRRKRIC